MFLIGRIFFQSETSGYQPLADLYETEESLVIEMDIPGVRPEDIIIKACDDIVIIEGMKREDRAEGRLKYICMERNFESFRRIIKMPVSVNYTAGKASYKEGVVTITLPKIKDKVFRIKIEK